MTSDTVITTNTRQLTQLYPHLGRALLRDNTIPNGRAITAGVPYNPDVLGALDTLRREVPRTCAYACQACGERHQPRKVEAWFKHLPRLAGRLHALGDATAEQAVTIAVVRWVRVTKLALGLRTPDLRLGVACPLCEEMPGELRAAGSEGFLHTTGRGVTVEWEAGGRIFCPQCAAVWDITEWALLGRLLEVS